MVFVLCFHLMDPSTVFQTFDMDQVKKIRQHHWKERYNISKLAKFESDTSSASEDMAPQSCANLQTFIRGGGGGGGGGGGVGESLCLHHTNCCKIS